MGRVVAWFWKRYRPAEGWLPLFLLLGAVAVVVAAVLEVEWVPEASVVTPAAVLGLVLGIVLAKRPLRTWIAWLLLTAYGLVVVVLPLAEMFPPWSVLAGGWSAISQFWRQQGALFIDRTAGWLQAVVGGARSQETVVFALGLGLLAWFLTAFVAWSVFRQRRPLMSLSAMGVALAANGYYGNAHIGWAAVFTGFAALITAVLHFTDLEQNWQARGVDYSDEIRFDLVAFAGGVALVLISLALLLPTFKVSALARSIRDSAGVRQAEETLERVFAGVRQPRRGGEEIGAGEGGPLAGSQGMPRSFLLGDAPELYETLVMTAVVEMDADTTAPLHWRGITYDVYEGGGWSRSKERQTELSSGETIPLPPLQASALISQHITWNLGSSPLRYTLGRQRRFDQTVSPRWRGLSDLAWVQGEGSRYQAVSEFSTAGPDLLRQVRLEDIEPAILGRYTLLPDTVPERVSALAAEIAAGRDNVYDQAQALERFLRQYPYSLDVPFPPTGVDPVDFFLFEQQSGYCDYYASAMVVLARSLGLPARLGVGFLAQPADEAGVQSIYRVNGHSWAEIYFADYGWIEFEPTAGFPAPFAAVGSGAIAPEEQDPLEVEPPTIPRAAASRPFPWQRLAAVGVIGIAAAWLWRRQASRKRDLGEVAWSFDQLQRQGRGLGVLTPASQTPNEFGRQMEHQVDILAQPGWLKSRLAGAGGHIQRLSRLFALYQYSGRRDKGGGAAGESWRRLRWPLRLLRLVSKLSRKR